MEKIRELRDRVEFLKHASVFDKGEAAERCAEQTLEIMEDFEGRLSRLETKNEF